MNIIDFSLIKDMRLDLGLEKSEIDANIFRPYMFVVNEKSELVTD